MNETGMIKADIEEVNNEKNIILKYRWYLLKDK